jgi:hypothetical protein
MSRRLQSNTQSGLKGSPVPKKSENLQEKDNGNIFELLDTLMIASARDYTENSSIGS